MADSLPARLRISIDRNKCVGSTMCIQFAPDVFALDSNRQSAVINPQGDSPSNILAAAEQCPLCAISLHDADTNARIFPQ